MYVNKRDLMRLWIMVQNNLASKRSLFAEMSHLAGTCCASSSSISYRRCFPDKGRERYEWEREELILHYFSQCHREALICTIFLCQFKTDEVKHLTLSSLRWFRIIHACMHTFLTVWLRICFIHYLLCAFILCVQEKGCNLLLVCSDGT